MIVLVPSNGIILFVNESCSQCIENACVSLVDNMQDLVSNNYIVYQATWSTHTVFSLHVHMYLDDVTVNVNFRSTLLFFLGLVCNCVVSSNTPLCVNYCIF